MFKVPVTKILNIFPHNNAERLEIVQVFGFNVVVPKNKYKVGDLCVYIQIDSIMGEKIEKFIFPPESKIKLSNGRVRQIRIRGFPSQGMILSIDEVTRFLNIQTFLEDGMDLSKQLNISKYEPPTNDIQSKTSLEKRLVKSNRLFHKYNGLENIKWFNDYFKETDHVFIQEKIHGSSCRAGKLPLTCPTLKLMIEFFKDVIKYRKKENVLTFGNILFKFIKGKLGLLSEYENCYGSNNVELTNKFSHSGFYKTDIYIRAIQECDGFNKIKNNELIYGEVIGEGIQKNYHYGHKTPHFVLFDVKIFEIDGSWKWLNPDEVIVFAKERGFDLVPILYNGPYNRDLAYSLSNGPSVYYPEHKVREGIVIKRLKYNDYKMSENKSGVKWVSEIYLDDKNNTDNH